MEFQDGIPVPVILNSVRPGRQRPRLASEHVNRQPAYYQDANGMLIPASSMGAPLGRSTSQGHHRPASVVMINNSNYEDRSPSASPQRSSRHRHSHGHEGRYDDSDSFDERERTSRHHSKHHHKRYEKSKSRSPSPYYDYEYEEKMKRLELYDRQAEEEEAKERFKEQQLIEKAKKEEKKKEEEKMKEKAVEEWKIKKLEKEAKERKEKEEADREFTERVKETFGKAGYSEESIEKILQNGDKKELGQQIMDLKRPTYIKVRREHLSPETLDVYDLPWEYDRHNPDYIVIKQWVPEHDQEILFEHTRTLRDGRRLSSTPAVEVKRRKDGNLLMIRDKSPSRSASRNRSPRHSWMFT